MDRLYPNSNSSKPEELCIMSVPIQSDGMAKYILEYMSKGWTPADQYVSKFLSPAKGPLRDAIRSNPGVFRPPKLPNQQLYDAESYPIVTELPDGYALLTNAAMGGTLGIFGHPSGQSFKNALDFLPHFQWLGSRDVANTRCLCRLCTIIYQQEDFMRQATTLSESPSNNSYISPFGQMGLENNAFDNGSFDENSFFPSLDMSGMQSNMNGMQSNMNGMQSNMNVMQSNMGGMQTNMSGVQTNITNLLGGLNDHIISPGGLTSPMELFPSHLSNLSQIPLQKSISMSPNDKILVEENHEQPPQNITQSLQSPQTSHNQVEAPEPLVGSPPRQPTSSQQSVELSPQRSVELSPQSSVQLSPQTSVQASPQSSVQPSPRSTIDPLPRSPIDPSPQSPIDSSPHSPSKKFSLRRISPVKTPLFAIQEQPAKQSTLKPPRKPRAKKAKGASTASTSTIPHHGMTSPTTADEQSVQRSIPRTRISSPKSTDSPLVTIDDSLIDQNILRLRTANEELGKDINMLVLYIKRYEKKIGRLKFERRLILNSLNGTMQKKNLHSKRYRTDTTDSVGTESEPLQTDEILEAQGRLSTLGSALQSKLKRPRKKRIKLLDPNAPKRPANAFIMFCDLQRLSINSERRLLQKLDPESEECKSMGQLTKALGSKWRNLNEDERKEYQDMYHEQVEWYDIEIKLYLAAHPNAPKEGSKEPLPDDWTDLNAPKRPANPFFVFCELEDERLKKLEEDAGTISGENGQSKKSIEEEREELNRVSMALITRWRNLEEWQRKEYVDEYEARLEVYNTYMSTKKTIPNGGKSGHFNQPNLDSGEEEEDELEDDDEPEVASLFKFESSPILNFVRPED